MYRKKLMSSCLAFCFMFLAACSKDTNLELSKIENDTLYVSADGKLELANVEEFSEEQYKEDELKGFIEETIRTYQESEPEKKDAVVMKKLEVENKVAKVLLKLEDAEAYTTFQGEDLKFLTSEEISDNLVLPEKFKKAADGKSIEKDKVLSQDGLKYLIVKENLCIKVEGTIKYYTDAMLTGDSEIQTTGDSVAIVVFE